MVKKISLDTNFLLRYALVDNKEQYPYVISLIEQIEAGKYLPYINSIVFLEINFVLSRLYKKAEKEVNLFIDKILQTRNLTIVDKTNFKKALSWHRKYHIKLADCLIASSLTSDCVLITWDQEFDKIKEIVSVTPKKLIDNL